MTRRTFFSALAALPFLSRVKFPPKPNPQAAIAAGLGNVARAGLDYIPQDASYCLKKGEIVLNPKTANAVRNAWRKS